MPHIHTPDGVKLYYRTFGNGPLPVLLVHGWMVSGAVYDRLLDGFDTGGLTVIVPDLRGTGQSDKPDGGYTIARYAEDILAIAAAAQAGTFVVVGHSMGGQIAQWLAATVPDRVLGAVLLCPVPAAGMLLPPDIAALFQGSGKNREAQRSILRMACKELSSEAEERLLDDAGSVSAACVKEAFGAWSRGGFADKLEQIRAPTLAVATDDPFLTPDFLRREVTSKIAGARLAYLPGPGHYVQVERPQKTAAVLQAFLAALRT